MTWDELIEIEPMLTELEAEARNFNQAAYECDPTFCANDVWLGYGPYPGIKPRLLRLVGWMAVDIRLSSEEVYDLAYQHIYNLLPNCGEECGCW